MAMMQADRARCRKIVKLAASLVEDVSVKSWLENDEYGSFELHAKGLLGMVEAMEPERKVGITDDQIDDPLPFAQGGCGDVGNRRRVEVIGLSHGLVQRVISSMPGSR